MGRHSFFTLICALVFGAGVARADTMTSYTGVLSTPDNSSGTFVNGSDAFILDLTLTSTSTLTLQTYGFGGGVNYAGTPISPGGTDPFVGLFSGTGDGAVFIDGNSLDLTNYTPGCPLANTVSNFGGTTCGDVRLTFDNLAAGDYTVLLSDGQYIPCADVSLSCTTLGDGAADFTGYDDTGNVFTPGVFCNLIDDTNNVITDCPNSSGAYALDVTVSSSSPPPPVPEPGSLVLLGTGLLGMAGSWKRRRR